VGPTNGYVVDQAGIYVDAVYVWSYHGDTIVSVLAVIVCHDSIGNDCVELDGDNLYVG